jgi:hypothetical protein
MMSYKTQSCSGCANIGRGKNKIIIYKIKINKILVIDGVVATQANPR